MANTLTHSPSDIIRRMLIDLGLGVTPAADATWPIYAAGEPNDPDNCITIYDTTGVDSGRSMINGELLGLNGFQVRIRSTTHPVGWLKADSIQRTMAQSVLRKIVHAESSNYLVQAVSKISDVLTLGKDTNSKRSLFTINAVAAIKEL